MELFNKVILNPEVPFAMINNFFKILKDFTPKKDWVDSSQDHLLLKESQLENPTASSDLSNYSDVKITIAGESGEEYANVSIDWILNVGRIGYISREYFIRRLSGIIEEFPENPSEIIEIQISGVFYFPQQTMNNYIMADLVMNDPIFSDFMSIDEHDKASKKGLYIHFFSPLTGAVTARITQKISDITLKDKRIAKGEDFEIGTYYLRVLTKANTRKAIETFQKLFSKFIFPL